MFISKGDLLDCSDFVQGFFFLDVTHGSMLIIQKDQVTTDLRKA